MVEYVKISELPVAGSAAGTDMLEANQAGTTRRITVDQLLSVGGTADWADITGKPDFDTLYVNVAGDVMTGNLALQKNEPMLTLDTVGTSWAGITGSRNGVNRWTFNVVGNAPETGSNVGSDFMFVRWADNGDFLGLPLVITRSTGELVVELDPTQAMGVATKNYVDLQLLALDSYLPLIGGALTGPGNLTIAGTLGVTGALTGTTSTFTNVTATTGMASPFVTSTTTLTLNAATGQKINHRINNVGILEMQATSLYPVTTNTIALGGASNRWSGVYSVLGDFTGNIGTTGGINAATFLTVSAGNLTTTGGNLVVNRAGDVSPAYLYIQSDGGQPAIIALSGQGNADKWRLYKDTAAEAASNVGADFVIEARDNAGNFLATSLKITRSNSTVTLTGTLAGTLATMSTAIAVGSNDTTVATTKFVKDQGYATTAALGSYLPLTGGTLVGPGTLLGTTATFTVNANAMMQTIAGANASTGSSSGVRSRLSAGAVNIDRSVTVDGYLMEAGGILRYSDFDTHNFRTSIGGSVLDLETGSITMHKTLMGTTATFSAAPAYPNNTTSVATTAFVTAALAAGASISVGTTPPGSPTANQLWWNSDASIGGGQLFIYFDSYWVPASPPSGVGTVVQTVVSQTGAMTTGATVIPADDTIPQITEGNEYMTCSITPTSATSRLIINVTFNASTSATGAVTAALFQDTTANAIAASFGISAFANLPMSPLRFTHTMVSGSTSARTYRVRGGSHNAGTMTFNGISGVRTFGGMIASSIVIQEVL